MAIKLSETARNNMLDGLTSTVGGSALIRIYSGSRPATVADAITGTLLAELTCNATFAPAATGGVLTLNAIASDSAADNTGTATHFRLWKSDGTTPVMDGDVGTSGADLNFSTTSFVQDAIITITSFTITAGNA